MEFTIAVIGLFATIIAIVASCATLYVMLRRPVERLETRLVTLESNINQRFTEQERRLDQRFTEHERRLDQRFTEQDQRFTGQDQRFREQDQRFREQDQRFDTLVHDLAAFRLEVKDGFSSVHTLLARQDERIGALERQQPRLIVP